VFIGYLADRTSRTRLVVLLSGLACLGSVMTGFAPVLWFFIVARMVNGAGVVGNQPVHRSLLSDYYDRNDRGAVFGVHQSADSWATLLAPALAGSIGTLLGWRSLFFLLAAPIAVFIVLALRLKEPVRGGTDDAEAAVAAEKERPLKFEQAVRTLAKSATLRRTWLGLVFIGGGFLPLATFLPLFLHSVFGLTLFQRGIAGSITALFGVAGLLVAGRWVQKTMPSSPARVQAASGVAFAAVAVLVVLFALSPTPVIAVAWSCLLVFVAGFFVPASVSIQAFVSPPRVRTQGFAFGGLFLAAGAFLAPIAGGVADRHGLRTGLIAFTPLLLIGGALLASAARFVDADRKAALESLETAARMHQQRELDEDRPLLVCHGVDVSYGSVQVLFGVDFEVREGEIIALLGTNGAGKSTLLKAVSGLLRPDRGQVFFDGEDVTALAPWETAAQGIVLMPGGKSVFPLMTVAENLRLAGWLYRREQSYIDDRLEHVLELFPRLRERYHELAGNMSGGEQQMLSLAQAFIAKPRLLMIDELSLGLAPKVVGELLEIVRSIHAEGVTVILVEQSVNVALTVADRACFLEKGEVRFSGRTQDLLDREDVLRSVFLEGAAQAEVLTR
jgi:branched-chain amino acid transport system ATP-binding protein